MQVILGEWSNGRICAWGAHGGSSILPSPTVRGFTPSSDGVSGRMTGQIPIPQTDSRPLLWRPNSPTQTKKPQPMTAVFSFTVLFI